MLLKNKRCQTCFGDLAISHHRSLQPIYELGSSQVRYVKLGPDRNEHHCIHNGSHDTGWTFDEKGRLTDKELYERELELRQSFEIIAERHSRQNSEKLKELADKLDALMKLNKLKIPDMSDDAQPICDSDCDCQKCLQESEMDYKYDERC